MYNNSSIPNMADVVISWSLPMVAYIIEKKLEDYELVETKKKVNFKGVPPQPSTPQEIQLLPEGERDWNNYTIYSTKKFKVDSVIMIDDIRYRIMKELNYSKDDSIDILNKLNELKFIEETTVEVDGECINLYKTRQFPEIVGLFAYLDLVSKASKNYYFYFGGPTDYFNKEGNMND